MNGHASSLLLHESFSYFSFGVYIWYRTAQLALSQTSPLSQALSWMVAFSQHWPLLSSLVALAFVVLHHLVMAKIGEFVIEQVGKIVKPIAVFVMKKIFGILGKANLVSVLAECSIHAY
jgi:hypothetical protein